MGCMGHRCMGRARAGDGCEQLQARWGWDLPRGVLTWAAPWRTQEGRWGRKGGRQNRQAAWWLGAGLGQVLGQTAKGQTGVWQPAF